MSPAGDHVNFVEAARMLGISPATLRRWIRDGRLPYELSEAGEPVLRREDVMSQLDPSEEQ